MVKVVDNFLDKEYFKEIQDIMLGGQFPWFYNPYITDDKDQKDKYYFTHNFYDSKLYVNSNYFNLLIKFLNQIGSKSLIRVKGNLYLSKGKKETHRFHKDYSYKHKACILYVNDNNGLTYFNKKEVKPKANRIVFFDPSKDHASSLPTDDNRRININVNYF
tara:strand:- start:2000 stop:2482 length:483 start_codon:yes stop_codon:yes gene_type:complete